MNKLFTSIGILFTCFFGIFPEITSAYQNSYDNNSNQSFFDYRKYLEDYKQQSQDQLNKLPSSSSKTHIRPNVNGGYSYFENDPNDNLPRQRDIQPDGDGGWFVR